MLLNLAVFLLLESNQGSVVSQDLAVFGPAIAAGEWHRLITSGFVHYGIWHIGFNMLLLYQLGSILEASMGRLRFLALYMASMVGGGFLAMVLSPDAFTAGASGAVFGLCGAALVGQHLQGFKPSQTSIGWLVGFNLIATFVIPGISIGGHIGGLVVGALCGSLMLRSGPTRRNTVEGIAFCLVLIICLSFAALQIAP